MMDKRQTEQFKQAIITRAHELGMDPNLRHTCSPGIKALAQMYHIVLRYPHLLQIFADDLLIHDFRLLTSPDAPSRFVWTIRPSGTNLFYPEPESGSEFLFHMRTEPASVAYTFDSENLELVHNLDYAARFLTDTQDSLPHKDYKDQKRTCLLNHQCPLLTSSNGPETTQDWRWPFVRPKHTPK